MYTPIARLCLRLRVLAGSVSTLVVLGCVAAAGTIVALMTLAVAGSVASGLFVWSKVGDRRRERRSLY